MSAARSSYLKTIYVAIAALVAVACVGIGAAFIDSEWRLLLAIPALASSIVLVTVIAAGSLVLHRQQRSLDGRPDLFISLTADRSESSLSRLGLTRVFSGHALFRLFPPYRSKVGDLVEVASWEEIERTLDARGTLEGVPFMREMLPFCGRRARILRRVDKVYDYGKTKTLRRLDDCVLLVDVRCDGAAHGGCQARCSMFWKTAWLKPAKGAVAEQKPAASSFSGPVTAHPGLKEQHAEPYTCQYTEVAASSSPMKTWDIRQDLRPLLSGNVPLTAFFVALLTWEFNRVQQLRGGIPFPELSNSGLSKTPVTASKNIQASSPVRVHSMHEIGKTLDVTGRNRGLWFDREMTKHCRQPERVLLRVERIIDDATQKMVPMKTPCLILEDVVASGEFLHFVAQQEYLFWREAWLDADSQ